MSSKQSIATINGHALQVPNLNMHRIRTAQATFTTKAFADLTTGNQFTITDNDGTSLVFEYRKAGGSGTGDVNIDISGDTTAAQVAATTVSAIASATTCLRVRASASSSTVTLKMYSAGFPTGNSTPSNTSGSPLTSITVFSADTDPLPPEEISATISQPNIATATVAEVVAAGDLSGTFYYMLAYYDIISDEEGPHSLASSVMTPDGTTNGSVLLTFSTLSSSAPSRATHIRVYRTTDASRTDFRLIAQVGVGRKTYEDEITDAAISITQLEAGNNNIPSSSAPVFIEDRKFDHVVAFNGRAWGIVGNLLRWSKQNKPSVWEPVPWGGEYIGNGDNIAMAPMGDSLIVYKAASIHIVDYEMDPTSTLSVSDAFFGKGALNKKCVAVSDGRHFVLDGNGVYMFEDYTRIVELSGPIVRFMERMNLAQASKFSIVATTDVLRCYVALDADTECQWCFSLDLRTLRQTGGEIARWWPHHSDTKIADSCLYTFGSSAGVNPLAYRTVACVQDTLANVYMLDWLSTDGAPSNLCYKETVTAIDNSGTGGVGRITHAATSASRGFTDTWSGSTYNALGLCVRFVKADGSVSASFQITQVDSNVRVELDRAFTSAELTEFATTTFYVGTIHTIFDSKEFTFGPNFVGKQLSHALVSFDPSPFSFTQKMTLNRDRRGADYMQATIDDGYFTTTDNAEGVNIRMGGDEDEGGYGIARAPIGSDTFRTFQFRLEGWEPGRPWSINDIILKHHDEPVMQMEEA